MADFLCLGLLDLFLGGAEEEEGACLFTVLEPVTETLTSRGSLATSSMMEGTTPPKRVEPDKGAARSLSLKDFLKEAGAPFKTEALRAVTRFDRHERSRAEQSRWD